MHVEGRFNLRTLPVKESPMDTLTYYRDHIGDSLTVWYGEPSAQAICEETDEEVILMKNSAGAIIGQEILHVRWNRMRRSVCW